MSTTALDNHAEFQAIIGQIRALGHKYIEDRDYVSAQLAFRKLLELDPKDIGARFAYAQLIDDSSSKKRAEARDMLLGILDDYPGMMDETSDGNLHVIRAAAVRCSHVGPLERAKALYRRLAVLSNDASDYFHLSEMLSRDNEFEEAVAALEKAIALDPSYDVPANRETLELARCSAPKGKAKEVKERAKVGRYPETKDFLGDLQMLITNHIAVNLAAAPKFLDKSTRFFTMGSCFARNLSKSLNDSGYNSHHMEISEY
ncbi:GSCFA domain-containing protein, partial [Bradyrhizobium sp. HKCCYLS2038]